MIGMDPEFLLVQMPESKIVPASRFLERTGIAGCDSVTIGGRRIYPIAELRPARVQSRGSCWRICCEPSRWLHGTLAIPL